MRVLCSLKTTALFVLLCQVVYAQSPKIKHLKVSNTADSFMGETPNIIGDNESSLFLLLKESNNTYIQELDKSTFETKNKIELKEQESRYKQDKKSYIYTESYFVYQNKVCFIKRVDLYKQYEKFYLEIYSLNDQFIAPTIISALEINEKSKIKYSPFIKINNKNGTVLFAYLFLKPGTEETFLQYKIFALADGALINSGKAPLPVKFATWDYFAMIDFTKNNIEFSDDNNIHILNRLVDDPKASKKEYYSLYSVINTETGEFAPFVLKTKDKNIFSPIIKADKNQCKIFGFYQDKAEKYKNNFKDIDGYYYATINTKTAKIESIVFKEFSKEDIEKISKPIGQGNDSKKNVEELSSEWQIENIITINEEIFLIGSKAKIYESTGEINKSNILILRLSKGGEILNITNLYRAYYYTGARSYIKDIKTLLSNNKLILIFPDVTISARSYIVYDLKSNEVKKDALKYEIDSKVVDSKSFKKEHISTEKDGMFYIHQNKAQNTLGSLRFE